MGCVLTKWPLPQTQTRRWWNSYRGVAWYQVDPSGGCCLHVCPHTFERAPWRLYLDLCLNKQTWIHNKSWSPFSASPKWCHPFLFHSSSDHCRFLTSLCLPGYALAAKHAPYWHRVMTAEQMPARCQCFLPPLDIWKSKPLSIFSLTFCVLMQHIWNHKHSC